MRGFRGPRPGRLVLALLLAISPAPAGLPAPGTSWSVDPATALVTFDLEATLHTVHGKTGAVAGWVRAVSTGAGGPLGLEGEVRIEAATLDTGNGRRDRKMRAESLDVENHPDIVFVPERLEAGEDPNAEAAAILSGRLTLRGVTHPMRIPVSIEQGDGGRLRVEGGADVEWEPFGVPDPSFLFIRIAPRARVHFRVDLVPSGERSR